MRNERSRLTGWRPGRPRVAREWRPPDLRLADDRCLRPGELVVGQATIRVEHCEALELFGQIFWMVGGDEEARECGDNRRVQADPKNHEEGRRDTTLGRDWND